MGDPKSWDHGYVVELYEKLFVDLSAHHPLLVKSFLKDMETIRHRVAMEGISFCTKVLPKLGKAFDAALDTTILEIPLGIKRSRRNRTIPAFMQGMFSLVFSEAGRLLDDTPPLVVKHIRQVLYLVYKLKLEYSQAQEQAVIDGFLDNENFLLSFEVPETEDLLRARKLLERLFSGFDPKDIRPRHGPGAVASGQRGDQKWEFDTLYDHIHQKYPYYDYYVVGRGRELLDRARWYRSLNRTQFGIAKVCLVPKDSRGPRLISVETLEYQYIQQGLARKIMTHLESHKLTKGYVNFSDQSTNQQLAIESSIHHAFATLDLKDASDRVSLDLVRKLIPKDLLPYVEAVRSYATELPNGVILPLAKHAPMGSAMCFPIMSVLLWSICVSIASKTHGLEYALSSVFVYGDDLIVPTTLVDEVVEGLTSVGLLVNTSKSFYRGDFRESCGVDAFKGIDVTPIRISTPWVSESRSGAFYSSYVAYANDFIREGYDELGTHILGKLQQSHGRVPAGFANASYPCKVCSSFSDVISENLKNGIRLRWNPRYQRVEAFTYHSLASKRETVLDGWQRLARNILQGTGPEPDQVVLPYRTKMRRRWGSIGSLCKPPRRFSSLFP
jgi:hypothetical protein